ncbi:hypothetical protein [Variovorax paradoxus]|uniref:Uncharacterized protein n=1 Tax=Variovorax paradoxus TaxID=34073 RepID=A0A6I6HF49_VARPD|nr:hypothetical protein [Variovorax paradoxus]QGW80818.1 hypothetical protein GOQ09_04115 [Variovorax paradoxus]
MRANDKSLSGPVADELTPLEISQAVLEGEENPNTARPLTPLERAATGIGTGSGQRSSLGRMLCSPAVAWGAAAVAGLGLLAALAYAKRESTFRP